jgi:hypothetical protein
MDAGEEPQAIKLSASTVLPPHFIILQLETNDTVFLMLRLSENGKWHFTSSRHRLSKSMDKLQSGMHLTVDPSSRYMAVGSSEGSFALFSLHSKEELVRQDSEGSKLCHIETERYLYLHGVILKMEFLHPSRGKNSEDQIVLLILLVHKGRTRMILYEWKAKDPLDSIHQYAGRKGHLLEESRQMPLLVIPLAFNSSFILVSENSLALCHDILQGSPTFVEISGDIEPPTAFHHGLDVPLWTAWTRPPRLSHHTAERDVIHLVREDGLVRCLEFQEDEVEADITVGPFQSNCGSALASVYFDLSEHSKAGDYLITGGDSGAGGAYLVSTHPGSRMSHNTIMSQHKIRFIVPNLPEPPCSIIKP